MAATQQESIVTASTPAALAAAGASHEGGGLELAAVAAPSSPPPEGNVSVAGGPGALPSDASPGSFTPTSVLVYPKPLATQEAVLADEQLFMETFYSFHTSLKSKPTSRVCRIPKMGGRDLDVHLLYREVSSRGGLNAVIRDRKWKEITLVFKLPSTTTSASYVLRRYYVNLLFHYEQVYRNGVTGPILSPPANLSSASPSVQAGDPVLSEGGVEPVVKKRRNRKRKMAAPELPAVDPAEFLGTTVVGNIDGKLDFGYLVTMAIGGEKLKGVLYHVPPGASKTTQYANLPVLFKMSTELPIPGIDKHRRKRRRKDEMPKKDPNAPRPNRTGYNFFFAEQRQRLKQLHPEKDREISKMIGEAWNALTDEQKTPYQERGVEDKERFKKEIRDYRERLKIGDVDKPVNGEGRAAPEGALSPGHASGQAAVAVDPTLPLPSLVPDPTNPPAAVLGDEGHGDAVVSTQ